MSDYPPVQDDITLVLRAQKVIVHETVRVNVAINAQVDPATSETDFRNEIQSTLKKFIDTDWKIQSINRYKGANRYETVSVAATARVPEAENYQLQERATGLSRIGFELLNPSVDYSLTFDEIQAVNEELRLTLINKALAETNKINGAFKDGRGLVSLPISTFRVSSTRFDAGDNAGVTGGARAYANNMTASANPSPTAYTVQVMQDTEDTVGDLSDAALDLNVSTRFSMTGTFVLRHVVKG